MSRIRVPLALSLCASLAVVAASWDVGAFEPYTGVAPLGLRQGVAPHLDVRGSLPAFEVGGDAGVQVVARNLSARPLYRVSSGALPPGIEFTGDGRFTGRFAKAGNYDLTVAATDGAGNRGTVPVSFRVLPAAPDLVVAFDGLPESGRPFRATVSAPEGTGIIDWSLDSGPAWVAVTGKGDTATVSGTVPEGVSRMSFTVAATDGAGRAFYAGSGEMTLVPSLEDARTGDAVGSASAVGSAR